MITRLAPILQPCVCVALSNRTLQPFYHEYSLLPIARPLVGLCPTLFNGIWQKWHSSSYKPKLQEICQSLLAPGLLPSLCDQAQATFLEDEVPDGEKLKFLNQQPTIHRNRTAKLIQMHEVPTRWETLAS